MPGIFDTGIFDVGIFDHASVEASVSISQAGNSVVSTAVVVVAASLATTTTGDSASSSGSVLVSGSANTTAAGDTVSSPGTISVSGTVSVTAVSNSVAATGTVAVKASLSVQEAGNTASATSGSVVTASVNQAQASNTVSVAGTVQVRGSASVSQTGNSLAGSGAAVIAGDLAAAQASDGVSAEGSIQVRGAASASQSADQVSASGVVSTPGLAVGSATLSQDAQSVSVIGTVRVSGIVSSAQDGNTSASPSEPVVVAPSYSTWAKRQNKNKPQAPTLPPPVEAGEIVIDEAVLRQMEEERLAALVLQRKTEALDRVEDLRAYAPADRRPTRSVTIDPRRFDVVEAAPEVRTRVISLFREQPKPTLVEPVRGSITLRALGPRHLPEPEIRNARTISLRRAPHRTMQTGL